MTNRNINNLPVGIPVVGSIEQTSDGGHVLHLRAALPCQDPAHAGTLHIVQTAHEIPFDIPVFEALDFSHLYGAIEDFVDFGEAVVSEVEIGKKGLRKRLVPVIAEFEDALCGAVDLIADEDEEETAQAEAPEGMFGIDGASIAEVLGRLRGEEFSPDSRWLMDRILARRQERLKAEAGLNESDKMMLGVLRQLMPGAPASVHAALLADFKAFEEETSTGDKIDGDKVLAKFPKGHPLRDQMKTKLGIGIAMGWATPYEGYVGPLPADVGLAAAGEGMSNTANGERGMADAAGQTEDGAARARREAAGGRATAPAKPGDGSLSPVVTPERTVVVSVTKKQSEDYAQRGVFPDVGMEAFVGKAVAMDLRLSVDTAEQMFTDAQTQSTIGTGPRRRIYQMAAARLQAALNRDPD